jgi:hypothetical protein
MSVRTTSIEAYKKLKAEGKNVTDQEKVYLALKLIPNSTDSELAFMLEYEDPNKVRPRRKELLDLGLIESNGKRQCKMTGRKCLVWRLLK